MQNGSLDGRMLLLPTEWGSFDSVGGVGARYPRTTRSEGGMEMSTSLTFKLVSGIPGKPANLFGQNNRCPLGRIQFPFFGTEKNTLSKWEVVNF